MKVNDSEYTYTWCIDDGPYLGESAWSIMHKFCYRNSIGIAELIQYINKLKIGKSIPFTCRMDLRFKKTLITQSILKLINRSIHGEGVDTLEYLTQLQDIRHLSMVSANHLRYCESCITNGYHATINQLLFRKTCHIHPHLNLKEECPECKSRIPYTPPSSGKTAYACPFCLTSLLKRSENKIEKQQNAHQGEMVEFTYSTPISSSFFGFARAICISSYQLDRFMDGADMFLNYKYKHFIEELNRNYTINTSLIKKSTYQTDDIKSGYGQIFQSLSNQIEQNYLRAFCFSQSPIQPEEGMTLYAFNQWCHYWGGVTENWQSSSFSHTQSDNLNKTVFDRFISKYQISALSQFPEAFRANLFRKIFSVMCESSFRIFLRECQTVYPSYEKHLASLPILTTLNDGAIFFTVESSDSDFLYAHFFLPKEWSDARPFLSL